jgi:hypothetical protein
MDCGIPCVGHVSRPLETLRNTEITTACVIGASLMVPTHAPRCRVCQAVNFAATYRNVCPDPQFAQNDPLFPYVPDLGDVFPEVEIFDRGRPGISD